jgi:hypothetical protein
LDSRAAEEKAGEAVYWPFKNALSSAKKKTRFFVPKKRRPHKGEARGQQPRRKDGERNIKTNGINFSAES